jgi:hypothetical protein
MTRRSNVRRQHRRARPGEVVCRCDSYSFPHREFGGACACERWVARFYDPQRPECGDCINRDGPTCQVVEGIEKAPHCPELRQYVRYEGVVLYGRARRQFERSTRAG